MSWLGLGVIFHLVPFQGLYTDGADVPADQVSHDLDDTHEIPLRELRESPSTLLGLGVMLQLVPFHDSILVPCSVPFTVLNVPTALHVCGGHARNAV